HRSEHAVRAAGDEVDDEAGFQRAKIRIDHDESEWARMKSKNSGSRASAAGVWLHAMKPVLHVLTGPTAVGKTEWALRWAEANGAEIVSCDSLLFYRGMNLGTAKPTAAERARVPH